MKKLLFLLFGIYFCLSAYCQDTIIVYDLATQDTSMILPVSFNTNITSDHSPHSFGSMGDAYPLSYTAPTTNLFPGSSFSDLAKANGFFNLATFPARTCVNVKEYKDSSVYIGTGMLVGSCFVLVSGNSIFDFTNQDFDHCDSLKVFPGFNNGSAQVGIPSSKVKKMYLFKTFLDQNHWDDVGLLELDQPIGLVTGWTGIGFDSSPNFINGKVFHKFSYPSKINPFDSSKVYNGDTLYYNYGSIISFGSFYGVANAALIPGQSGSTFLYTDNSTSFYSVGLASWSSNYYHYAITNKAYYSLLNVLTSQTCNQLTTEIYNEKREQKLLKIFPNPTANETTIEFEYDPSKKYTLNILDLSGRVITNSLSIESGSVKISTENLNPGAYLVRLQNSGNTALIIELLLKD